MVACTSNWSRSRSTASAERATQRQVHVDRTGRSTRDDFAGSAYQIRAKVGKANDLYLRVCSCKFRTLSFCSGTSVHLWPITPARQAYWDRAGHERYSLHRVYHPCKVGAKVVPEEPRQARPDSNFELRVGCWHHYTVTCIDHRQCQVATILPCVPRPQILTGSSLLENLAAGCASRHNSQMEDECCSVLHVAKRLASDNAPVTPDITLSTHCSLDRLPRLQVQVRVQAAGPNVQRMYVIVIGKVCKALCDCCLCALLVKAASWGCGTVVAAVYAGHGVQAAQEAEAEVTRYVACKPPCWISNELGIVLKGQLLACHCHCWQGVSAD